MPTWLAILLYVIALLCFGASASGLPSRVNLMAVGLAAWVLVPLLSRVID
jgi:hypothetical protein